MPATDPALRRARSSRPALLATVGVTGIVLGPLLIGGGIALRGDMVFVPDQPWKPAWLGLDGSVPRAVPMDALVALADEVLPGAVLQRVLLAAALLLGGAGISRLAARFTAKRTDRRRVGAVHRIRSATNISIPRGTLHPAEERLPVVDRGHATR